MTSPVKTAKQQKFLLTPLREGRRSNGRGFGCKYIFLLTPLREGRREDSLKDWKAGKFLLTPLREGRRSPCMATSTSSSHFYSRPCGRGDQRGCLFFGMKRMNISTHAPAGGATGPAVCKDGGLRQFLLTPLREGRRGH